MKIVFLGFASTFTPGMAYQDNVICNQVLSDGHEVTYLSNPEKYEDGEIISVGPEDIVFPNGLHLIRLPYVSFFSKVITKKLRVFRGVYKILEQEQPNVIFCHNTQYWPILDVAKYKKRHPEVRVYADTHAAYYNSGMNWVSRYFLHRIYYRFLVKKALPSFEKVFFIGESERRFAVENYHIPNSLLSFFPLGGTVFPDELYYGYRKEIRELLCVPPDKRLYGHAGKLTALKKTEDLIKAFAAVDDPDATLIIMGSIPDDRKELLLSLINSDARIKYLGWLDGDTLQKYLCACDLYCQPFDNSSIFQNAICCRCAIMAYPHDYYTKIYDNGNILWEKTTRDMVELFNEIASGSISLSILQEKSIQFAEKWLDYKKLVSQFY